MASEDGVKAAWRELRTADHVLLGDVVETFSFWGRVFEGVSDASLLAGVLRWLSLFDDALRAHPSERDLALRSGRRFPLPVDVSACMTRSQRRAAPTDSDLAVARWWPPSGVDTTPPEWVDARRAQRRLQRHIDAGCIGVWRLSERLLALELQNAMGLTLDERWPEPPVLQSLSLRALEDYQTRSCAGPFISCALAFRFDPAAEGVAEHRAVCVEREGSGGSFARARALRRLVNSTKRGA